MDFTKQMDDHLFMLIENTKFFKQMADALGDCDENGEIKRFLEESVRKRLQMGEKVVKIEQEHKNTCKAMDQAKGESASTEELLRKVDQLKQAAAKKSSNVKNKAKYKYFKREMESSAGRADGNAPTSDGDCSMSEVVQTGGDVFSLHDPWSMALMKDPVRNRMCGHIYDSGSVNAMIKDNLSIRCPVSGCANEHFIQPSHLVQDIEAQEKLRRHLSEQKFEVTSDSDDSDSD
ncbi:GL25912 [Drosophila persimilis]|uniref:E3 SUMO-protein ligase NSE2 n=1 Tax=Drosophila persimilis TaxID=7234 RepID=B4GJN2_DROPE|nr:E3 SUMO-protein ligase NSE2 [Drosophila persimilis]EDW36848.1 GL25912 [Drosophila persimilis]